jgi:hypothetical protein
MKIGKKAKVEDIENPFRPKTGLPRRHSVCRITLGSTIPSDEESEFSIQVDADEEPMFVMELVYMIPSSDRFRDNTLDLWFVKEKYKDFLIKAAPVYFYTIAVVDEKGKITNIEGNEAKRDKERKAQEASIDK